MSTFKFTELTVNKVPGIDDGFCLEDITSGINIVVGPNGSGKTSTRRALDAVLWPTKSQDHKRSLLNISAECKYGAGLYRTHLQYGSQPSFKDGRACDPISFGNPELKDQYHLSLHDLVQDNGSQFAKFIADLSVGGVDLDVCAKEIGAKPRHTPPSEDIKSYSRIKGEIAKLKTRTSEVKELESQLVEMRASADSLQEKILLRPLYSAALEYSDALSVRDAARSSLNEFPVQLQRITGSEYETLTNIEMELEEVLVKRSRLDGELNAIQKRIAASEKGGKVPSSAIASLNGYQDRLTEARSKVKDAQLKVRQCEAKVAELQNNIFDVTTRDKHGSISLSGINSAIIDDLTKIGKDLNKIDAEINQLNGEFAAMHDSNDGSPLPSKGSIENGIHALGLWLQDNKVRGVADKAFHLAAVKISGWGLAVTALCLIGIFAGFTAIAGKEGLNKLPGITAVVLFVAVAVVQVMLILWFRKMDRGGAINGPEAGDVKDEGLVNSAIKQYSSTGLTLPRTWTAVDVAIQINLLSEVRSKVAHRELIELRKRSLQERLNGREHDRRILITNAETMLSAIQYEEDDLPNLGYVAEFLRQVRDWQAAEVELAEARATADVIAEEVNNFIVVIDETLVSYGFLAVSGDFVKLKTTIKDIEQQVQEFLSTTTLLEEKNSDATRLFESFEQLSGRKTNLFQSVDLTYGDSVQLKQLCAQYKKYQDCIVATSVAEKQVERAYERVANDPLYSNSLLLKSTKDELHAKIDAIVAAEVELKRLNADISTIEVMLKAAETSSETEIALAQLDTLSARINQHREVDLSRLLGQVIIDHIKETTYDIHRPIVLQRTCELFANITYGKYELRFSGEEFHVLDTEAALKLDIDELSSGTKVQLQIAVRLAFVEEQEEGDKLPLFLDETLGTSDDYRAQAIIDSIITLAKQGRQIFYFTAQTDEVGKWKESLETEGLQYKVFELDKLRKLSRLNSQVRAVRISPVSLSSIEVNAETTHLDYGRAIGVPPIRIGHDDVGHVPLWYVIDDPAKLHSLRTVSIETFGPLVSIHKNGRNFPVKGFDNLSAKLPAIERLISATIKAINIGHGKRVDRAVLISSPVSRSKLFEQIAGLAQQVEGDASELLDALRGRAVSGLQTQLINSLEEHLRDEGCFLEDEQPLTSDEIRAFIVEEVSDDLHAGALSIAEIHSFVDRVNNPPK